MGTEPKKDWRTRTHQHRERGTSTVMQLKNGQLLTTIPREIGRWKHIGKGTALRWSDGGENRVIIEIQVASS